MKFQNRTVEDRIAGLEAWLETVRTDDGYGGPSVGSKHISMRYTGAANDWRLEGLLDGHAALHAATGNPGYLERIEHDITAFCSAQLLNGTFRNSCFDQNPYEGGMPHEASALAAACRAATRLPNEPVGLAPALELFVETRLINELWNRLLHTFNDWLQSDFQFYTPHAVAAAIEVLILYADRTNDWQRIEPYVIGAADSLLAMQIKKGPLQGAIPISNNYDSSVSPTLAARCAPALVQAAKKTGNEKYAEAAKRLAGFVQAQELPGGGYPTLLFRSRPPKKAPVLLGAAADAANSLERADLHNGSFLRLEKLLEDAQLESGAFLNARGFNDWRDTISCCGWQDKIYSLLARSHSGSPGTFSPKTVQRGTYMESSDTIEIHNRKGNLIYRWNKGCKWAETCTL